METYKFWASYKGPFGVADLDEGVKTFKSKEEARAYKIALQNAYGYGYVKVHMRESNA